MAGALPAAITGSPYGIFGGGNSKPGSPMQGVDFNSADYMRNPFMRGMGAGGMPGMGMPGMGGMPGGDFSRMPGQMPGNWQNRMMPKGGGMAADQTPQTLSQMATALSRGKTYDPMQTFAGQPMNPRYAAMLPGGKGTPTSGGKGPI